MARPSPRLPPVTMTLRMLARHFACRGNSQRGNDVYRCRNLMPGKRVSTKLEDLTLKFTNIPHRGIRLVLENYVCHHERTGYRILSRPDERHPDLRMPIDHTFDLFRMDLKPPNVDDPISPPHKIIAITPKVDHVTRVNEAL